MSGAHARRDPGLWARFSGGTTLLGVMLTASACALSSGVAPVESRGGGAVADPGGAGALFRAPVAAPLVPPVALTLAPVGVSLPGPAVPGAAVFTDAAPAQDRVRIAITFAMAQIGLPYVWGGNGPAGGHAGFDCSGLTTAAYAAAGVTLPRTAHTQYYAGPHVPAGAPLQPGDLVFYGVPSRVHHVGLYIGGGRMVAAPTFGRPVQLAYVRWRGDDYLGATRPAAPAGSLRHGLLPPAPLAPAPPPPPGNVFAAPPAPPGPAVLPGGPVPPGPAAPPPPPPMVEGGADPVPPGPTPTPTPTTQPAPPPPTSSTPPTSTAPTSTAPTSAPTSSAPTSVPPSSAAPSPSPAAEAEPAPASAAAVQPAATSAPAGTAVETTAAPPAP